MALVVSDEGMKRAASVLLLNWPRPRRVGLYSNVRTIDRHTTAADLTPTTFSGYGGELTFPGAWTVDFLSPYAEGAALPLEWTHDGGPDQDFVAGYYVLDQDGALLWAEPALPAGKQLRVAGQVYRVDLRLDVFTKYGGVT